VFAGGELGRGRARLIAQPVPEVRGESCQIRAEDGELSQDLSGGQVVIRPPLLAIVAPLVGAMSAHVGQGRVCHARNTNQPGTRGPGTTRPEKDLDLRR